MFPTIKQYYEMGLYTENDVKSFLIAGMITQDEYNQIIPSVVDEPKGKKDNGLLNIDKPEEENE